MIANRFAKAELF